MAKIFVNNKNDVYVHLNHFEMNYLKKGRINKLVGDVFSEKGKLLARYNLGYFKSSTDCNPELIFIEPSSRFEDKCLLSLTFSEKGLKKLEESNKFSLVYQKRKFNIFYDPKI